MYIPKTSGTKDVLAIIVTWNSENYIQRCLESLVINERVGCLVIDNNSTDSTVNIVRALFPTVMVIENGSNVGYGAANNIGISIALERNIKYSVLINPDVELEHDCLDRLVACFETNQSVGMASPVIYCGTSPDVWYAGSEVNLVTGTTFHKRELSYANCDSDYVVTGRPSGAVLMIATAIVPRVGYLDERFFLYYEETEWSLRAIEAGFEIMVVRSAIAHHDVGHGKGGTTNTYIYYMTRNRLLFVKITGHKILLALPSAVLTSAIMVWNSFRTMPRDVPRILATILKAYYDYSRGRLGKQSVTPRLYRDE